MASGAKLAFFDATPGNSNYLYLPSLFDCVFPISHVVGANVHSNSWYGVCIFQLLSYIIHYFLNINYDTYDTYNSFIGVALVGVE